METARQVLPQIEQEDQFHLARPELSTILPAIADDFATLAGQARQTSAKEELVRLSGETMELVNNPVYLPSSLRREREQRIVGVLEKLIQVRRSIDEDHELATAIEKIKSETARGHAAGAYEVRAELLRTYPGLASDAQLQAVTRQVGEKEQELVVVSQPQAAALIHEAEAVGAPTIVAYRDGPAPGMAPRPTMLLVEGAVYGIDAASGRVLWRRYVGYATIMPPLAVPGRSGADALAVDAQRQELVRLDGVTGKLLWRQPLGDAAVGMVVTGEKVIATARGGRVMQLDAASGEILRAAQLPQGATVGPAYDARQDRVLQPGEHSTLFVLAADTLACIETVYLGHKAGSLYVPAASALDQVLIAESPADDYSVIRVLAADPKTRRLAPSARAFRLKGRIVTPLVSGGRRIAAMTDLGQVAVYEVDPANAAEPVRLVAGSEATESVPLVPYYTLAGNRLWTGTRRRTMLEIQPALQQLSRRWSEDQGDWFIAPLQVQDDLLVYVRRAPGRRTALVEACSAGSGKRVWTTHLAAPAVALAASKSRNAVDVLTDEGRLFSLKADERAAIIDEPAFALPQGSGQKIFSDAALSADGGTLVWTETEAGGRVYAYEIAGGGRPIGTPLPSSAKASAAAQLFAGSLLVPLANGSVALLGLESGKEAATAFLPPITPGEMPNWTRPAVMANGAGAGAARFVVSDGRGAVYAVGLKAETQAHLALVGTTVTSAPIVSSLASCQGTAMGLMRSESGDFLVGFDAQGGAAFEPRPLKGRVQAGPFAVGNMALIAAEVDGIVCFDAGGAVRWQQPQLCGPLAGPPILAGGGDLLLVCQSGAVVRVNAETGKEIASWSVGQPLGGAGCIVGNEVFLGGSDGVVHRLSVSGGP